MAGGTEAEVADEVLTWFESAWDPDLSLVEWRTRLVDARWAVPSWSATWYGRDLPAWADGVAHRTIRAAGGVTVPMGAGMSLVAPTLYDHGSDQLLQRFLRPTLTGALTWCQLFSEPGAGSDLAGLATTAVRDGDHWVVSGQKVWNTSAHHADRAILLARTDWNAVKHAGITYFLLDMKQDGVEVRPIEQMNGHASFNEVFLTEAIVPHDDVVGEVGGGWAVARGTLAHERRYARRSTRSFDQGDDPASGGERGSESRVLAEARAEAEEHERTYVWYPQREGRADLLVERARATGRADDPVVRQEVTRVLVAHRVAALTADRARAARQQGRPPGPEGSIGKLALSQVARGAGHAHGTIAGARGMLRDGPDADDAVVAEVLVSTPAQSIAGGTDEIQHNIVGDNILGLPREPATDRGVPFREVRGGRPT